MPFGNEDSRSEHIGRLGLIFRKGWVVLFIRTYITYRLTEGVDCGKKAIVAMF